MRLDRASITEAKFAQAVDGLDRGDVRRHLEAIADALEDSTATAAANEEAARICRRATQVAEAQLARVRVAVADLLERVASLELGVQDAQRSVRETGEQLAQRLEESAAPLVGLLRERAEAVAEELDLLATEIDAPSLAAAATAEPPADADGQQPRTGLASGDRADAAAQLADVPLEPASTRASVEAARLVALNLALAGTAREETERHLREELGLADPAAILDEAYARAEGGAHAR